MVCQKWQKSKHPSNEIKVQIDTLFNKVYSRRQITKKFKIYRYGIQYSLQRDLETGADFDRKELTHQKLLMNIKINRRKT